ncbi:hypothetical protein RhiJN_05333 [Ceratobasidium sp. AG-Ba]|nr:hypothetical protein RhiJN_05333 [Ceratobasidium sp. AG-Ba]
MAMSNFDMSSLQRVALVSIFVLVFVSGSVSLCRTMNIGLYGAVAHIAHLSFDQRAPSPLACIPSACGVYLAVRLVRQAATWSPRTWIAALASSIGRSDGCEMYDQEYDWPVDPTLVTPLAHGLKNEEDRLSECQEEVSWITEKRPRKHIGCGRFSAGFGYVVGFRSEVHSVESRVKSITPRGHNGLSWRAKFHPQSTCNSTAILSTSASHLIESMMTKATSEPSNIVQAEDMHTGFEQCGSLLAPVVSTSPVLSNESLPDLVYDSSASSDSLSQVATPVQRSGFAALYRPVTSLISLLCSLHKYVGRGQPRFSPLDAPKSVVEASTATRESKAIALLRRSEWKQKAKLRRSRNVVHGSGGSRVDLVHLPMDDIVEVVEPNVVLESVLTQQWIQADVVLDSPFALALLDVSPRSSPMGSPLEDLDARDDTAAVGPVGTCVIKPVPRLRRRMQAARSGGTDAPLMVNVVCAASLGSSTCYSLPPKSTGLENSMSLRSDQGGSASDLSVTPSPSSSIPIVTPAAEWVRARQAYNHLGFSVNHL